MDNSDWSRLRDRWDCAAAVIGNKPTVKTLIRKPHLPFLLPVGMPIAITGEAGNGKTELYRALTGDRGPVGRSAEPEQLRALIRTEGRRIRATFTVIPGQESTNAGYATRGVFGAHAAPKGIIHVVSAGHARTWEGPASESIEDSILRKIRDANQEVSRMKEEGVRGEGNRERLQELEKLSQRPLDWHLREHFKASEASGFRSLCQSHISKSWNGAWLTGASWMIVAVTKCDLWFNYAQEVRSHYLPGEGDPGGSFAAELRGFWAGAGSWGLKKLAVLPVASYPSAYKFGRSGGILPVLEKDMTDRFVDHFRNVVGEFCAGESV